MLNAYLAHHGILGQKWGVRRYQNEDGSLTEAGRKKYGSEDHQEVEALKKKSMKELSNEELEKIAKRKELERAINSGNEETKKILIESGTKLLTTAAVVGAAALGGRYVVKHLPEIAGSVVKATAKTATNVGSEVVKEAANVAKNVGHDVRKTVASSNAARKYVNTIDTLLGKKRRRK